MTAVCAVVAALVSARAWGFARFLLSQPDSLDGESLRIMLVFGLVPAVLAAAVWLGSRALGRWVASAAGLRPAQGGENAAVAALGLGLLAQSAFLAYWARVPELLLLPVAAALFLALRDRPTLPRKPRLDAVGAIAAALLAYAAVCALVRALAPATEWDIRAYHLALPELYARARGLVAAPWLIHSHWPHLMEALYAPFLALGAEGATALIHAGAAVALVAATASIARDGRDDTAAWAAALLLAGQPALLRAAGTAHSDAASALFALSAAVLLARWERDERDGTLALAGLLAGFCAASKMLGLGALGAWSLWVAWRTRRARAPALFIGAGLCAVGPWLARTWARTGNPIWPFLSGPFGSGREAAELAARYMRATRWDSPPAWLLTHDGPLFLLLPLAGLLALTTGRRAPASRVERLLLLPAPFYLYASFRHHEAWRFFMPVWPALALAAARGASAAWRAGGARRVLAGALVLGGAASIPALEVNNELFAVFGVRPSAAEAGRRAHWEDRAVPLGSFYREARALLPPTAKVLLWRETRGYGAGFDYLWGDPINQGLLEYRRLPDPAALRARLKELGITHVLENADSTLYREDPGYYDARTLALMAECLRAGARARLARGGLVLHELL